MPVTMELDRKMRACGDKVVIRKLEKEHERVVNGIVVPYSTTKGFNMCKGIVESIGPDINEGCLKVGDKVLFDHYSTYGETYPVCVTKIENIIVVVEED